MLIHPESLNFAYLYFSKGSRFVYLIAFGMLIFNSSNYYSIITEAKSRNIKSKYIKFLKIAMFLNIVIPTVIFLQIMRIDMARIILMTSVFYTFIVYYVITRLSIERA